MPTGREWHGRRNSHGGVHWEQRFRSADPGGAGRGLAADCDLDAVAS